LTTAASPLIEKRKVVHQNIVHGILRTYYGVDNSDVIRLPSILEEYETGKLNFYITGASNGGKTIIDYWQTDAKVRPLIIFW